MISPACLPSTTESNCRKLPPKTTTLQPNCLLIFINRYRYLSMASTAFLGAIDALSHIIKMGFLICSALNKSSLKAVKVFSLTFNGSRKAVCLYCLFLFQ